jgi:hypothetical protein
MLFIIVADALTNFLRNATPAMAIPVVAYPRAIQFADDMVIVTEAHPQTLKVISLVLTLYENLSGLKVN